MAIWTNKQASKQKRVHRIWDLSKKEDRTTYSGSKKCNTASSTSCCLLSWLVDGAENDKDEGGDTGEEEDHHLDEQVGAVAVAVAVAVDVAVAITAVAHVYKSDGEGSKAAKEEDKADDAQDQQRHLGICG